MAKPKRARGATPTTSKLQDLAYRLAVVSVTTDFRKTKGVPFLTASLQMKRERDAVELAALLHEGIANLEKTEAPSTSRSAPKITVARLRSTVDVTVDALSLFPSRHASLSMLQLAERMHAIATGIAVATREQIARTEARRRRRGPVGKKAGKQRLAGPSTGNLRDSRP